MKKHMLKAIFLLPAALLCTALLFTACGAGGASRNAVDYAVSSDVGAAEAFPEEEASMDASEYGYAAREWDEGVLAGDAGGTGLPVRQGGVSLSEKIIYSAEARIETIEFDAAIEKVYDLLEFYGAFIENSYIEGSGDRSASFTLRVPRENFTEMTDSLPQLGNLLSVSSNAVNIQTQYTDAESRLAAYRTEEERLLAMLSEVKDVESMIAVESRLSDVRYELESLTSRLRDWDNQINYSSLSLYIDEVKQLRTQLQPSAGYAQELKDGFVATLRGIGVFFMEIFKFAVIALPAILLLAIAALIVLFIVKRTRARRAKRTDTEGANLRGTDGHGADGPGGRGTE
ncbi:MAG: DUF4349 domain-containing protein [Clostridiales Family XIII bacterium]|jgi:hypothetical protein|nr:DUF4349 domain-containing protein [Clostridiales Family XIII bacterium]